MASLVIKPDGTTATRRYISHEAWRRLEKRPRAPARARHWTPAPGVRLTEAGLSLYEAELGVRAVGQDKYQMRVGRILDYDPAGNRFLVVGKATRLNLFTAKWEIDESRVVEQWIPGPLVSAAVVSARVMVGVSRLTREMSGR